MLHRAGQVPLLTLGPAAHVSSHPLFQVVWAQEEPMNMGAYFHVQPRMVSCLK